MKAKIPWSAVAKPVIGMVHLAPLPGAPRFAGDASAIVEVALRDAKTLTDAGVHALLIENFGDTPFFPGRVPAFVVAHMTAIAERLRREFPLPLGINVLRNDGAGAMAIASAVGAAFVRVNVLCGARVTDQGILQGIAHELLRERRTLGADAVQIVADVNVKHSAPVGPPRPLEDEVADLLGRGGADALVVSGSGTGRAADVGELQRVAALAGKAPVLLGSGVNATNLRDFNPQADGFIVGSSLKIDGKASNAVDPSRAKAFMAAWSAENK